MRITLQDLIDQVAEQTGATKKLSEDFLREFLAVIENALEKEGIAKIKGLGTFKLQPVEERKSVNVQTGEEMIIPSHNKISFTSEKELKAAINKPYSHLETYILSKEGPVDSGEPEDENENENENEEEEYEVPVTVEEELQPEVIEEKELLPEIIENEEEPLSIVTEREESEPEITQIVDSQPEITGEETKPLTEVIEEKPLPEVVEKEESNHSLIEENEQGEQGESCKNKKSCKWLITLIILSLIALLIWLWCSDYPKLKLTEDEGIKTEDIQVAPTDEIDEIDENVDNDTIDINQFSQVEIIDETAENAYVFEEGATVDSTTPNPNRNPEFEGEYMFDSQFDFKLLDFMQANHPYMKLITYGTPREVELAAGRRLTLLALEYYGHKHFWVYIYLYNTDVIKNPNNIPVGTMVKVPRLDKSLVDPNNEACVNVAQEIQRILLKM